MTVPVRVLLFTAMALLAGAQLVGCGKSPEVSVLSPAVAPAQGNVSDVDVTEHVKTALQAVASLQGFDIAVVTAKGDVRLTGVLGNQSQIDEALQIARAAEGVHAIHDELTLKP